MKKRIALGVLALCLRVGTLQAEPKKARTMVRLKDGSAIYGTILSENRSHVVVEHSTLGKLRVPKTELVPSKVSGSTSPASIWCSYITVYASDSGYPYLCNNIKATGCTTGSSIYLASGAIGSSCSQKCNSCCGIDSTKETANEPAQVRKP